VILKEFGDLPGGDQDGILGRGAIFSEPIGIDDLDEHITGVFIYPFDQVMAVVPSAISMRLAHRGNAVIDSLNPGRVVGNPHGRFSWLSEGKSIGLA
jgi:hypothetical protein